MRIGDYSFGRIVVDGETYTSDIIVFPGRVKPDWWRREGHRLALEDLKEVLESPCRLLVVGTGRDGVMKVPGEVVAGLEKRGIEVRIERTPAAVALYNRLSPRGDAAAALHLTC